MEKGTLLVITGVDPLSPHGKHHFKEGEVVGVISTSGEAGVHPSDGYAVRSVTDGGYPYKQYIISTEYKVKESEMPSASQLLVAATFKTRTGKTIQLRRSPCRHYMVKEGRTPWTRIHLSEARAMLGNMI